MDFTKSNALAEQVLMVGDNIEDDIEGAQVLGIKTALYNFGKQKDSNVKPDYVINNYIELKHLLEIEEDL